VSILLVGEWSARHEALLLDDIRLYDIIELHGGTAVGIEYMSLVFDLVRWSNV
jgi:hypothetical protein